MTEDHEDDFRNNNICRFCEKEVVSDKVRDHCHLTGQNQGPAHNTCSINVLQKGNNLLPFAFHNFSNNDCHMFFKRLVDLKIMKLNIKFFLKQTKNIFL